MVQGGRGWLGTGLMCLFASLESSQRCERLLMRSSSADRGAYFFFWGGGLIQLVPLLEEIRGSLKHESSRCLNSTKGLLNAPPWGRGGSVSLAEERRERR